MTSRTRAPETRSPPRTSRASAVRAALGLLVAAVALPGAAAAAPPVLTGAEITRFGQLATNGAPSADAAAPGCALLAPGSERSTTAACLACHDLRRTHPVDLDYAQAAAREPGRYAPAADVVRAGGYLPDGQLRCVTCHDRRSPWRYQIALPAGAVPTPSVAAMRSDPARYPELTVSQPQPLPPGSDVTPTPLCRMCHVM